MKILKNISGNIYIYFMLLVIFIVTLFLVSFSYEKIESVNSYNKYFQSYFNINDAYYPSTDVSLPEDPYLKKLDLSTPDGLMNTFPMQILAEVKKQGVENFGITRDGVYQSENIGIAEVKDREEYKQSLQVQVEMEEVPNIGVFINSLFGENIQFPLKEGKNFVKSDFSQEEYIPVIAGYLFSKDFKLGDELKINLPIFPNDATQQEVPAKIIGFLEEDTPIFRWYLGPEILNSNNIILLGISEKNTFDSQFLNFLQTTGPLEWVETKNKGEVEELILELGKEKGYEGKEKFVKLVDPKEVFSDAVYFDERSDTTYYIIMAGSVFVSMIIMLLAIYLVIKKNKETYEVLLANGGEKKDVIKSISMEMMVVLILANIINAIIVWMFLDIMVSPIVLIGYNALVIVVIILSSSLIVKNKKQ